MNDFQDDEGLKLNQHSNEYLGALFLPRIESSSFERGGGRNLEQPETT